MKKFIALIFIPLFILSACGNDEKIDAKEEVSKEDVSKNEEKNQSVEVDKGLLNVEITLPASFFGEEENDEIIANAKADGVKDVIVNDDGSLTYKMSKSKHKEMLTEVKAGLLETIDEIKVSEDYASIKDVEHNKSFTDFTIIVDQEMFENSFDGFATLGVGMSAMFYQLFTGTNADDYKITIDIQDDATGELIDTVVYPDALEE